MPAQRKSRPVKSAPRSMPNVEVAAPAGDLNAICARFPALIARWLDLFEGSLLAAEQARASEPAPAKPPEAATLREVVNALTLCVRLRQLSGGETGIDGDQERRDLEAVERAISEAAG